MENEQGIFVYNRMTEVTAMSVTVTEIQVGLSIFMLQNYQLNQNGLFIAKVYFEEVSSS